MLEPRTDRPMGSRRGDPKRHLNREGLARIMRMFQLERLWKERSHEERKALRNRYLRVHVASFLAFAEEEYERVKHQRGMLRSALGYCARQTRVSPFWW